MVGDDAVRGLVVALGRNPGLLHDRRDQCTEQIGLVIVMRALQDRGNALEAHAGVDRGLGQVEAHAAALLLVLHEDEVPDLDEAVAVGLRRSGRPAPDLVAMVIEDFRARTAGAGIAHPPEIVGGRDADDAAVGQACDLLPQRMGLVVFREDGDGELVLGQPIFAGDQFPRPGDGVLLEIVAEGEIAEHLEEGVVAGGVADIVEVIVLAAGAHAFLGRGGARVGPLLGAGEDVLELHHARIGEHQGRVVARHQRRGGDHLMALAAEEVEEGGTDLCKPSHGTPGNEKWKLAGV